MEKMKGDPYVIKLEDVPNKDVFIMEYIKGMPTSKEGVAEVVDIVAKSWHYDPSKRASLQDFKGAMKLLEQSNAYTFLMNSGERAEGETLDEPISRIVA